jgi:hypothetical protein
LKLLGLQELFFGDWLEFFSLEQLRRVVALGSDGRVTCLAVDGFVVQLDLAE